MKIAAALFCLFMLLGAACRADDVRIPSGDINLAATFYPASGAGTHPAIVLLAGSGKSTRSDIVFLALERAFNASGFGVLAYDKRGSGQSGGNGDNELLATLAGDGINAVHYLQSRPDVDPKRVGVWGISQGGWLGPLMASMSPDVAFVISVSGPGVSVAEQEIYLRGVEMLGQGYSAQDVRETDDYRRVVWAYYGTGLGREAAQAALDVAKTRPWFAKQHLAAVLPTLDQLDPGLRAFMRNAAQEDPLAVAAAVKVPVLTIFGAKDGIQPVAIGLENLIQAYARGGNTRASFALFPDAGHGLQVVTEPVECHECAEKALMQTHTWDAAPGFFDLMTRWLKTVAGP